MKSNQFRLLMPSVLGIAFLAFANVVARASVEDTITNSFKVESGGQLVMDVDRGSIEIKTAEAGEVRVEVKRKAGGSRTTAEKTLKDHIVTSTQDGSKVEIRAELKSAKSTSWFSFSRSPELEVSYLIVVPRKFDVDIKTGGGHIKVTELNGKLQANTSGGNLTLEKIGGPVSVRTAGGHITLAGCQGKAKLDTSGGNLTLSDIKGDVAANTSGGHISVKKLGGKATLKTSGGNIEAIEVKGPIEANTSGGHVTVELREQPMGDCSFETSGGNITLGLAANLNVNLDVSTSGGRISTDIPVTTVTKGEPKEGELRGKINAGGPQLYAHTSGGHIRVRKAD
jgi:hypothetical protein